MKKVLILGASGSIGTQTIEVIFDNKNRFSLIGITVGENTDFLANFLKKPAELHYFYCKSKEKAEEFSLKYPDFEFYSGEDGLLKIIEESDADIVVNALSGFAGFLPSIKTLELNKTLLLANKESLVAGGHFIKKLLSEGHGKLYPIDSEHVAIAKCLRNFKDKEIDTIYLTASGGPFFGKTREELRKVTLEDALNHPTWNMGNKITIDSSTLMNKAFEIAEASYLFNVKPEQIKVKADRKSYIHSFVKFKDGTIALQVGKPDMREPIRFALNFGEPFDGISFKDVEVDTLEKYDLLDIDTKTFPLINLGYLMCDENSLNGCVINAANEVCVLNFLRKNIKYIEIEKILDKIISTHLSKEISTIFNIVETDKEIREITEKLIEKKEY